MAHLFFIHWHKDEAQERARLLREAGHTVTAHFDSGADAFRLLKETIPDALIISIDRLPSHGRRVAAVAAQHKVLRKLPTIFVGGEPEKIGPSRKQFPDAAFSDWFSLDQAIGALLARRAAELSSEMPFAQLTIPGLETAPPDEAATAPAAVRRRARKAAPAAKRKKRVTRRTKTTKSAPRAKKAAGRKKTSPRTRGRATRSKARSRKK